MALLIINKGSSSWKISLFNEQLKRLNDFESLNDVSLSPTLIGHRIVHGGSAFLQPTLITPEVEDQLTQLSELAPLHNPSSLAGIDLARKRFPGIPQYAVFDTAFHASIPEKAALYPIPLHLSKKHQIKRYGFHGISHAFLSNRYSELHPEDAKIITLHLGSGCSIAAIQSGISIDTSMGFTPLDGLMMSTRSGELDPAIIAYLCQKERKSPSEIISLLNDQSGLQGISGTASMKELLSSQDKLCLLAVEMFVYRIVKYIGAYAAAMNGVDALIFSGGIGENAPEILQKIISSLSFFKLHIDPIPPLTIKGGDAKLLSGSSKIRVYVIGTDENYQIAKEISHHKQLN